ncbi:MAG: peptide ABC transporter substrate-binding protein [Clostridiales bacterium]|jgi:oligopeptide transport system substrate-binding protein|nr:peptide ABC transporter substrate-binding protein [Clostridiales bacterium]
MKMNRILSFSLATVLAVTVLVGCGGSTESAETSETPAANTEQASPEAQAAESEPAAEGEEQYLNDYLDAEPATLDPSKIADQYGNSVINNLTEKLTVYQLDENGNTEIAPAGAESWEITENDTVYTFKLRENYWQDGTKVTAADYEYGIKRTLDPVTGSPSSYLLFPILNATKVNAGELPVEELGVKALDENTLEITLEGSTPYFLSLTYQNGMSPLRQDIVEQYGDKYGSEAEFMMTNGPFNLTSWTHNSELVLTKNENYWDKDNVRLDTVNFAILQDENARHNSFDNNSVDVMATSTEEWVGRFEQKEGVKPDFYTLTQTNYSFFNVNDEVFSNENIRKAFILSIDREGFNDALWSGYLQPAYGWVPPGLAVGDDIYRDVVEEPLRVLAEENTDAKALLLKGMEELGLGSDPNALTVTWSLGGTDQRMRTVGEFFQQTLKNNLGVNLEIELNDWPMFQSKIVAGEFQIGYMAWGAEYNDPYSMLSLLMSNSNAINTGWVNEEYDAILVEASTEMDDAKRMELYKEAEFMMLHDHAVMNPVLYSTANLFIYSYVKNYPNRPQLSAGLKHVYIDGR